ncbi:MAG: Na+/H+ antiporter subunit C [Thauera sp.]|jgi:multicomponent K+:H+ antiporter subunit C
MEFLVASAIGVMTAAGIYLVLRARTFPVVIGLSLLTYATNLFLFATGRLAINQPPVIAVNAVGYIDPLPQALVLTAIVISFGMTAVVVVMALRAYLETGNDHVDLPGDASPEASEDDWKQRGRRQQPPPARSGGGARA